jgi:hypothetical protein
MLTRTDTPSLTYLLHCGLARLDSFHWTSGGKRPTRDWGGSPREPGAGSREPVVVWRAGRALGSASRPPTCHLDRIRIRVLSIYLTLRDRLTLVSTGTTATSVSVVGHRDPNDAGGRPLLLVYELTSHQAARNSPCHQTPLRG